MLVALTGGIGSGKSVVSQRLAARGAVIVDADAIVHELQRAGSPLLDRLAERFGAAIIRADGELDRAGLAAIAFNDDAALADLNGIVHPAVRAEIARRVEAERDTDHVVVLDMPLLTVASEQPFDAVIVVDLPVEAAVERLVRQRGMDEADAAPASPSRSLARSGWPRPTTSSTTAATWSRWNRSSTSCGGGLTA